MAIIILYGSEGISAISWKLFDGSTLTPYKTKDGKLHLGQTGKDAKSDTVFTVDTSDALDRESHAER